MRVYSSRIPRDHQDLKNPYSLTSSNVRSSIKLPFIAKYSTLLTSKKVRSLFQFRCGGRDVNLRYPSEAW